MKLALTDLTRCGAIKALLFILTCSENKSCSYVFFWGQVKKKQPICQSDQYYQCEYFLYGRLLHLIFIFYWTIMNLSPTVCHAVACVCHSVSVELKGTLLWHFCINNSSAGAWYSRLRFHCSKKTEIVSPETSHSNSIQVWVSQCLCWVNRSIWLLVDKLLPTGSIISRMCCSVICHIDLMLCSWRVANDWLSSVISMRDQWQSTSIQPSVY